MKKTVVLISREDDEHATLVGSLLRDRFGCNATIFNTSEFPATIGMSADIHVDEKSRFVLNGTKDFRIELDEAASFWWRRPQGVTTDERISDPTIRHFTMNECFSSLYGMLHACGGFWVNNIENDERADYKPYQLKTAVDCGLQIPATLITNDPVEVMRFWDEHRGDVVYKAFNQRGIIWCATRRLQEKHFSAIERVKLSPTIFQEHVPGRLDIRVTVIGERIFATEFEVDGSGVVDYRLCIRPDACRAHDLPEAQKRLIISYMNALGLEYGGLDFRLTPDGRYVFFEINTEGEFRYIEKMTEQPLSLAMAEHLAAGVPSRRNGG